MTYALSSAQERFAAHYAAHGSQTEAFRAAYNPAASASDANERGRRLLRNQVVRDRIGELRGRPLPPMPTARDPRPTRSLPTNDGHLATAISALASVASCTSLPSDYRLASLDLLSSKLSELAKELRAPP